MNKIGVSAAETGHDWGDADWRGHMGCLNSSACQIQVRYLGSNFQWRDEFGTWHPYVRGDMPRCVFSARGTT